MAANIMKSKEKRQLCAWEGQNTTYEASLSKTESIKEQASRDLTNNLQEILKAEEHSHHEEAPINTHTGERNIINNTNSLKINCKR